MILNKEIIVKLASAARKAGGDVWQSKKISGDNYVIRAGSYKLEYGLRTYQPIAEFDDKSVRDFVSIANPANILSLVNALEAAEKRLAELENRE